MPRFVAADLPGVFVLEPEPVEDDRGWFARSYCRREFADNGLNFVPVQSGSSYSARRGTLRGLHYQGVTGSEAKLIRCTAGAIFDVAVDIRADSESFGSWVGCELTAENRKCVFLPEGFAHGFQTLVDSTEVLYLLSEFYDPAAQAGIRWDDPTLGIEWPAAEKRVMSDRDRALPLFAAVRALLGVEVAKG